MESNKIKLSFIIPAHNEENYIGHALNAIVEAVSRTAEKTEIIVVDNASSDKTREAAEKFPGVSVFFEPKKGTNIARQRGFFESKGELIANIDADNILSHDWLKIALEAFERDPNLVALSGPYYFYNLNLFSRILIKIYYFISYPVYVFGNKFHKGGAVTGGNLVIRRSALEKIGGYNTDLTFYGDDTDTANRLNKIGKVKFDYKFIVYSSPRRLKSEGMLPAVSRYAINHIWVWLFGRAFHKKHAEVTMTGRKYEKTLR